MEWSGLGLLRLLEHLYGAKDAFLVLPLDTALLDDCYEGIRFWYFDPCAWNLRTWKSKCFIYRRLVMLLLIWCLGKIELFCWPLKKKKLTVEQSRMLLGRWVPPDWRWGGRIRNYLQQPRPLSRNTHLLFLSSLLLKVIRIYWYAVHGKSYIQTQQTPELMSSASRFRTKKEFGIWLGILSS